MSPSYSYPYIIIDGHISPIIIPWVGKSNNLIDKADINFVIAMNINSRGDNELRIINNPGIMILDGCPSAASNDSTSWCMR